MRSFLLLVVNCFQLEAYVWLLLQLMPSPGNEDQQSINKYPSMITSNPYNA